MSSVDLSNMDNIDSICRPGSIASQTPLVSQQEPASQLSFSCPRPDGGESMPTSTIQYKSTRPQEPREQRWEDLKLLIRQIYIEEGKPFPYLAKVLEEEYDFKVTKKQFSRQIEKWGKPFRKNIPRAERNDLLRRIPALKPGQDVAALEPRLKGNKLKNWQRYRRDGTVSSMYSVHSGQHTSPSVGIDIPTGDLSHEKASAPNKRNTSEFVGPVESAENAKSPDATEVADNSVPQSNSFTIGEGKEGPINLTLDPMDIDQWPFSWDSVDVVNSPELSRFFARLEIECSTQDIPLLSLDDGNDNDKTTDTQVVTHTEILDIFNEHNRSIVYEYDARSVSTWEVAKHSTQNKSANLPWRNLEHAFFGWNESPLNEIYVFPPHPEYKPRKVQTSRITIWDSLTAETVALEDKLQLLERASIPDNYSWKLDLMEALADNHRSQLNFQEAEKLYRRIYAHQSRTLGPINLKTLETQERIAATVWQMGKNKQSLEIIDNILPSLLSLVGPDNDIYLNCLVTKASVLNEMGDFHQASYLYRQILQIRLNSFGPKDHRTRQAIEFFSTLMNRRNQFNEAERLLYTAIQLYHGAPDDEAMITTISWITLIQRRQGRYEESYISAQNGIQKFQDSLGAKHTGVLELKAALAWALSSQDQFHESERLFRKVLDIRLQQFDKKDRETMRVKEGLARVLFEMDILDEATALYEEGYQDSIEKYDPAHNCAVNDCGNLGKAYEKQARYLDALRLYQEHISRLQGVDREHPKILAIQILVGCCYYRQGRYLDALSLFQELMSKAQAVDTEHPKIPYIRGRIEYLQYMIEVEN